MNYPVDIHRHERRILDDLHQEYIPHDKHSDYYTVLTGLRLRIFEGIITNFLDFKKVDFDRSKGLGHKIQKTQIAIHLDQKQQINQLVGVLHKVRNRILHGNFEFIVTKEVWQELNLFLFKLEGYFDSIVSNDTYSHIDYTDSKASSLKVKISNLLA